MNTAMQNTLVLDIVTGNSAAVIAQTLNKRLGYTTKIDEITDIQELTPGVTDGHVRFLYADEPYDQNIDITLDKDEKKVIVQSNDPEALISVYEELCRMEWGWIDFDAQRAAHENLMADMLPNLNQEEREEYGMNRFCNPKGRESD